MQMRNEFLRACIIHVLLHLSLLLLHISLPSPIHCYTSDVQALPEWVWWWRALPPCIVGNVRVSLHCCKYGVWAQQSELSLCRAAFGDKNPLHAVSLSTSGDLRLLHFPGGCVGFFLMVVCGGGMCTATRMLRVCSRRVLEAAVGLCCPLQGGERHWATSRHNGVTSLPVAWGWYVIKSRLSYKPNLNPFEQNLMWLRFSVLLLNWMWSFVALVAHVTRLFLTVVSLFLRRARTTSQRHKSTSPSHHPTSSTIIFLIITRTNAETITIIPLLQKNKNKKTTTKKTSIPTENVLPWDKSFIIIYCKCHVINVMCWV